MKNKKGFTIVELLSVIVLLGIIITIGLFLAAPIVDALIMYSMVFKEVQIFVIF